MVRATTVFCLSRWPKRTLTADPPAQTHPSGAAVAALLSVRPRLPENLREQTLRPRRPPKSVGVAPFGAAMIRLSDRLPAMSAAMRRRAGSRHGLRA